MHKYLCDRHAQRDTFHEKFYQLNSKHLFFCVVHGPPRQSHEGLIKRFEYEYLSGKDGDISPWITIQLNEANDEESYKKSLIISLAQKFEIQLPVSQINISHLADNIAYNNYRKIPIIIEVKSSRWKVFTPKLIRWFIEDFCREEMIVNKRVKFYFFLNIIYENRKLSKRRSKWLLKKNERKNPFHSKIQETLRKFNLPQFIYLPTLEPVPHSYIDDWMSNVANSETEKEKYMNEFFPERSEVYDMEEIEMRLEKIIQKHTSDTF